MKDKILYNKILNLKDSGIKLFVPFLKERVTSPSLNFTATDGYHAALISMNLKVYITLKKKKGTTELSETDSNFLDSFTIILQEQESLLQESYKGFTLLINKYLEGEDGDNFKENLFFDPTIHS